MLQKTFSSFLLAILIIQWTALPLLWQWRLADMRYEKAKEVHEDELEFITISQGEWVQSRTGEHEIRLSGNLYDIKSIQFETDVVHLAVERDIDEEHLLETGDDLTHQKPADQQDDEVHFGDFFDAVYLVPDHLLIVFNADWHLSNFAPVRFLFAGRSPVCPDQPPQFFS